MGRYKWHVTVKGHSPEAVRHYNHVTMMYRFISRSHRFLGGKILTIHCNGQEITDIAFDEVMKRIRVGLKEKDERRFIKNYGQKKTTPTTKSESQKNISIKGEYHK